MAHRGGGFRAPRQEKDWTGIPSSVELLTTDAQTLVGGGISPGVSSTVLRMMGEYAIFPSIGGTFVAGDQCKVTVAVGIVSTDAFAVGGSSMPDPAGEAGYPWLFWREHSFQIFDSTPNLTSDIEQVRVHWESKAMRKMKLGLTLGYIVQYSDIVGTPPYTVMLSQTRALFGNL